MNEQGLAVGLTSVYPIQYKPGFNAGLLLRYLLEKCKNVMEAVSCLHQLPIASAQTLTLADSSGEIALVECNAERVEAKHRVMDSLLFTPQILFTLQKWRSITVLELILGLLKQGIKL